MCHFRIIRGTLSIEKVLKIIGKLTIVIAGILNISIAVFICRGANKGKGDGNESNEDFHCETFEKYTILLILNL